MRLIDVKAFQDGEFRLREFSSDNTPSYVILSHTWGSEEVLFSDVQNGTANQKAGLSKIEECCETAAIYGFGWVWIDTCCIDKSSSAELSEAINSMYRWYEDAAVCYAYLADIVGTRDASQPTTITTSRWFSRGWTLQELLAPPVVEFYDSEWTGIGTKSSLAAEISRCTGIPVRILHGEPLSSCCVAERMSWSANRSTTRVEDIAYCLMGVFSVSMPLLYGEGIKAFRRLQEQILMQEEDYSIFAWSSGPLIVGSFSGVFAESPNHFKETKATSYRLMRDPNFGPLWYKIITIQYTNFMVTNPCHLKQSEALDVPKQLPLEYNSPPQLTCRGLRMQLPLRLSTDPHGPSVAWIYCREKSTGRLLCVSVSETRSSIYIRQSPALLILVEPTELPKFELKEVFFISHGLFKATSASNVPALFNVVEKRKTFVSIKCISVELSIASTYSSRSGEDMNSSRLAIDGVGREEGVVIIQYRQGSSSIGVRVIVGMFPNGRPWCHILESQRYSQIKSAFELFNEVRGINLQLKRDRSAAIVGHGTLVAAAIRKASSPDSRRFECVLEIDVCPPSETMYWPTTEEGRFLQYPNIKVKRDIAFGAGNADRQENRYRKRARRQYNSDEEEVRN